jgi:leucine dehydrogenase
MVVDRKSAEFGYEEIIGLNDLASLRAGLHGVIALHSTAAGPAFGGIRRRSYSNPQAATCDARELARAMTFKCALAGLPAGGAKAVLSVDDDVPREVVRAVYLRLGDEIERLAGRYVCGPDVGTGVAELQWVRERTRFVNPIENDAAQATATGVLHAFAALLGWLGITGAPRVAIQGLGAVGLRIAKELIRRGARVVGADIGPSCCREAALLGVQIVAPEQIVDVACDVFMPCAIGGVLTEETVTRLRCRGICGSANNQLASSIAAERLMAARIGFVPDIIASAGAVIEGVITTRDTSLVSKRTRVASPDRDGGSAERPPRLDGRGRGQMGPEASEAQRTVIDRALAEIETRTFAVLEAGRRAGISTAAVAHRWAHERLQRCQ